MAAGSLLTLLDDIATLLDDVSLMTKVAAKKTAGVLGDDLALNAQQVTGVRASRELPIVWAVAKGSLRNKLILVPAALLISVIAPWLITPLLMLGGAFLCYEGAEKLAHKFLHGGAEASKEDVRAAAKLKTKEERLAFEKDKIKGAVRTDFILSAEIIAITLGTVASASFTQQVVVLAIIAVAITAAVYGLVAGIVKLDDLGVYLTERSASFAQSIGRGILWAAPYLMKLLSIVGTIAMFLVGGSILTHGVPFIHHAIENLAEAPADIPGVGAIIQPLAPMLLNFACGLLAGAVVLGAVQLIKKLRSGGGH